MKVMHFRSIAATILLLCCLASGAQAQENGRGLGIILEGFAGSGSGAGAVIGYHFGQHFFTGAGVSIQYSPDTFLIPVFADARITFGNSLWSPSAGVGAGFLAGAMSLKAEMDKTIRPYASITLGLRRRELGAEGNGSLWLGVCGEMAETLLLSLRIGYGF
ncbi:MAG: hypothetical protein IKX62_05020 [Bacteroidales bacterium]|nr:hypothetical protein [Bacteroidales bacterium]